MSTLKVSAHDGQRALYPDLDGRACAEYTVFNSSESSVSGFLEIVPEDGASSEWFHVNDSRHRDFRDKESQQVVVDIAIPSDAPASSYGFFVVACNEDDPDEDFSESTSVRIHWNPCFTKRVNRAVIALLSLVLVLAISAISGVAYLIASREILPQETLQAANDAAAAGHWDEYWGYWTEEGRDELLVRTAGMLESSDQHQDLKAWMRGYGIRPDDVRDVSQHSLAGDSSIVETARLLKRRIQDSGRKEVDFFVGATHWLEDVRESDSIETHTGAQFRKEFQFETTLEKDIDDDLAQHVSIWDGKQSSRATGSRAVSNGNSANDDSPLRIMFHKSGRRWLLHDIYPEEITRRTTWELLRGRNEPSEHSVTRVEAIKRPVTSQGEPEYDERVRVFVKNTDTPDEVKPDENQNVKDALFRQAPDSLSIRLDDSTHTVTMAPPFLILDNAKTEDVQVLKETGASVTVGTFVYQKWSDVKAILERDPFHRKIIFWRNNRIVDPLEIREHDHVSAILRGPDPSTVSGNYDSDVVDAAKADLLASKHRYEESLKKRDSALAATEENPTDNDLRVSAEEALRKVGEDRRAIVQSGDQLDAAFSSARVSAAVSALSIAKESLKKATAALKKAESATDSSVGDLEKKTALTKARTDVDDAESAFASSEQELNAARAAKAVIDAATHLDDAKNRLNSARADAQQKIDQASADASASDTVAAAIIQLAAAKKALAEAARQAGSYVAQNRPGPSARLLNHRTELQLFTHEFSDDPIASTEEFLIITLIRTDPLDLQNDPVMDQLGDDLNRAITLATQPTTNAQNADNSSVTGTLTGDSPTLRPTDPTATLTSDPELTQASNPAGLQSDGTQQISQFAKQQGGAETAIRRIMDRKGFDYFIDYMYNTDGRWFDWGWVFQNGRKRLRITLNRFGYEFQAAQKADLWGVRSLAFRRETDGLRMAIGDSTGNIMLDSRLQLDVSQNTWDWNGAREQLASLKSKMDKSLKTVGLSGGTADFNLARRRGPIDWSGTSTVMPFNKFEFALSDERSAAERAFGSVAISSDGQWLSGGDSRGRLRIWRRRGDGQWNLTQESRLGEFLRSFYPQIRLQMRSVAFSSDASRIAVAVTVLFQKKEGQEEQLPESGYILVLRRYSETLPYYLVPRLEVTGTAPLSVAFQRDSASEYLAAGLANGQVDLWKWNGSGYGLAGRLSIDGNSSPVLSVAFGSDDNNQGDWLATGHVDGRVHIMERQGGAWSPLRSFRSYRRNNQAIQSVAFSPHGAVLAGATYEGIRLWQLRDLDVEK